MATMQNRRPNIAPAIIGCLALAALLPAAYMGGYLMLSPAVQMGDTRFRLCQTDWLLDFFTPAADCEKAITGNTVFLISEEGKIR